MKRRIMTIVLAFLFLFGYLAAANSTDYQYAQVVTPKEPLNMRKTASVNAAIVARIPNHSILAVLAVNDMWCECYYQDQIGYVITEYLLFIDVLPFQTVSLNDDSDDILALKERLKELNYFGPNAMLDTIFDSDTEYSVALFQSAHGMKTTGIATPELQAFLFWGPAGNYTTQPSPALTPAAIITMTVTVDGSCTDYNHVGNCWSQYYSVNDKRVLSGDKVQFALGERISVYTEITEIDKYPDIGSAVQEIVITQNHMDDGFTVTQIISVKENKGRYGGNIAVWTVSYRFDP